MRALILAVALLAAIGVPASADDAAVDALIAAYPDHLSHRLDNTLVWRDGTQMAIDDGREKDHQEKLADADIEDMLSQAYPVGPCSYGPPERNQDPGRIRNDGFFRHMYGETRSGARANLVSIDWFGSPLKVTRVNGVDAALSAVARDLAALPDAMRTYFTKTAGAFNWRNIAGTARLSVHSFGAAIDINVDHADYWRWSSSTPGNVPDYRNRIPVEIVEAFERHGFVWGGKWYHYDTMHFEYRPELLALAQRVLCESQ